MNRHIVSFLRHSLIRVGIVLALFAAISAASLPAYATGRLAPLSSHRLPCVPKVKHCSSDVKPYDITFADTYQYTGAKPAMTYCNGRQYVAWAGTDQELYIDWNFSGGSFPQNPVQMSQLLYGQTGPSLACFQPRGATSYELYVAWVGVDSKHSLNVGYFDGNASHNTVQNKTTLTEYSDYSPAIADNFDGYLFIAWTGQDSKTELNIEQSSDGKSWIDKSTWTSQNSANGIQSSAGGLGLTSYCPSNPNGYCGLYVAWIGTDSSNKLDVGYYNDIQLTWTRTAVINNYSVAGFDATLVADGLTLRLPYAGENDDLNVLNSTDAYNWTNDNMFQWGAVYGVGGAASGGNTWLVWRSWQETDIYIGQYTEPASAQIHVQHA